jgi:hypothetical protein
MDRRSVSPCLIGCLLGSFGLSLLSAGCGESKPPAPTEEAPAIGAPDSEVPVTVGPETAAKGPDASAGGPDASAEAERLHTARSAADTFTVRWSSQPDPIPVGEPFSLTVELFEDPACTRPLERGGLSVDASMPHHGHGMNVRPKVSTEGPGRYRVVGMLCHMPGRWEFMFDHTADGLLERAQMTVELK